jgi:hypothetical protein
MELRFTGMMVGILVSFASAFVSFEALGLPGLFGPLGVGIAGAPVAALLGWCLSPHIVSGSWRRAGAIGIGAGLLAAPLGLLELLYIAGLSGLASGPEQISETVAGLVMVGIFGLGYCWVVLPITIPSGFAAALAVRAVLLRRAPTVLHNSSSIRFRHAVIVLALVALGAALVPLSEITAS